MSDLVPKIGLAIEGYKARQQDIVGLGHRAYKDLFSASNASLLTAVVQRLICNLIRKWSLRILRELRCWRRFRSSTPRLWQDAAC